MNNRHYVYSLATAGAIVGLICAAVARPLVESHPNEKGSKLEQPGLRSPHIRGESAFDAGSVKLVAGDPAPVHHTFRLRNIESKSVEVIDTESTCGCTSATVTQGPVPPEGEIVVDVTMRLTSLGTREERIWLRLMDDTVHQLTIRANAVKDAAVYLVPIEESDPQFSPWGMRCIVVGPIDSPPATPICDGLDADSFRCGAWSLVHPRSRDGGTPARWQCEIHFTAPQFGVRDRRVTVNVSGLDTVVGSLPGLFSPCVW